MNEITTIPIQSIAKNYCLCLADFPLKLKPGHLDVLPEERSSVFTGLSILRAVIGDIYDHFASLTITSGRWSDREYCYQSIEGPVKLLWALGVSGQLIQGSDGLELKSNRADLEQAMKRCAGKDLAGSFEVLKTVGFKPVYLADDDLLSTGGYKKCTTVAVRYPASNEPLLRALVYYAARLPQNKSTKKGILFDVFLRADFRPLLPDYTYHMPHLPADEEEVTRTFDPMTLEIWKELTSYMASHYPQYQVYFRVPFPRGRHWVTDFSDKDNDYGLWSIFTDDKGISVRIVFDDENVHHMIEHIKDLSPRFQEVYLDTVKCKDCVHCGKHIFYPHGDHVHRLCRKPWFAPPFISPEDLPDIERLIDLRLVNE